MTFSNYLKTIVPNKGPSTFAILQHWRVYNEWLRQIESKKEPLDLELPWITLLAKNYIEKFLSRKPKEKLKVLEYGSGGSSLFFLKHAHEVVSVEHSEEWLTRVKNHIAARKIKGWSGHLLKPEVLDSATNATLSPSNPLHYFSNDKSFSNCTFKSYASFIDTFPDNYFDIVLVDGRSRPSCIYHSMRKIKNGGLLVLDNAERKYYLSGNIIDPAQFELKLSSYGALICYDGFTQTNIYLKKS
jgi:hypothetical protein